MLLLAKSTWSSVRLLLALGAIGLLAWQSHVTQASPTSRVGVAIADEPYPLTAITGVPQLALNDDNVKYVGELTGEGFARLKVLAEGRQITSLTIASGGGEVSLSIDFGNWVFDNQLDVIVERACLSSCANYIFPAGRRKIIRPGAVVAWHGSARQRNFQTERQLRARIREEHRRMNRRVTGEEVRRDAEQMMSYMTVVQEKERAFYERIGVDEYVTRIGNERYGARGFYFLSVEDMERFGIRNVSAPEDYTRTNLRELNSRMPVPIVYVKLR